MQPILFNQKVTSVLASANKCMKDTKCEQDLAFLSDIPFVYWQHLDRRKEYA